MPKPMAPVDGRPFLEYLLFQLRAAGIPSAVLCVGYRADVIREHFGDGAPWGIELAYSVESEPMGTGGALKLAGPLLDTDALVLMNGDSLFDIPLAQLIAAHIEPPTRAPATLALAQVADGNRFGGVSVDADGQVAAFVEKPDAPPDTSAPQCINGGLYMIERTTLDLIPADRPVSFEREVLPLLVGRGLRGMAFDAYFVDIGVPEDYLRAQHETDVFRRLAADSG